MSPGWSRPWFVSTLGLLRRCRALWEQRVPTAMCGFGVDRHTAELALSGKEPGTFLIRYANYLGR